MSTQPDTRLAEEAGGGAGRPLSSDQPPQRGAMVDVGGLLIAAALLLFAYVIYSDAATYPVRRASSHFGPAIFPMMVAAGLAALGALTVWMGIKGRFPERETMAILPPLWIAAGLFGQIFLIANGGGFILATTVLFAASAWGLGHRSWLTAPAIGLVVTTLLYILFQLGLGLALPAGPAEAAINALFR